MNLTTWPYTGSATLNIECTSCHSVHDNDVASPFLWAALGVDLVTGTGAPADASEAFCQQCHNARSDVTGDLNVTAAMGSHPVEVEWNPVAASNRALQGRLGRTIAMNAAVYDVDIGDVADSANFDDVNNQWQLGGHTGTGLAEAGVTSGNIGCYSCHSAHAADNNALTLAPASGATDSVLCNGCHGDAGNRSDPGVTGFYHPVGAEMSTSFVSSAGTLFTYTASNGNFPVVADIAATIPLGTNNNELLCTSCHDVHGSVAGQMAIAEIGQAGGRICNECHTGAEGTDTTTNAHHITFTTGNAPAYWNGGDTPMSWSSADITLADGLDCVDCHVFNGTAHNW
jgi:predicted CXXCH cytochrome family protein